MKARLVSWFRRLRLKCDEPLSNFAFNFNLRRYTWDGGDPNDREDDLQPRERCDDDDDDDDDKPDTAALDAHMLKCLVPYGGTAADLASGAATAAAVVGRCRLTA